MNMELFRSINDLAYKNNFLDNVMLFFSEYVIYIFALITVLIFFIGIIKKDENIRFAAVNTVIFTCVNLIIAFFIGIFYYVDRPFVKNNVNLLYPHVVDASFPSDHATVTMSIALGLNKYKKLLGIILTILSLVVGFSRVYVGHHSPFDVIGTYIIIIITNHIYRKLSPKINKLYLKLENVTALKLGFNWLYE